MEKLVIYTDGGSRGNPGPSAIGYKIIQPSTGNFLCVGEEIGDTTNNIAEYTALCEALRVCVENDAKFIDVYMDSELVVKQIIEVYKVKNANLKPLYEKAKKYISMLSGFSIHHILRGKNKEADRLVNEALNQKKRVEEGTLFLQSDLKNEKLKSFPHEDTDLHKRHLFQEFLIKNAELSYVSLSTENHKAMISIAKSEFDNVIKNRVLIINKAKEFGYQEVMLNLKSYDE